MYQITTLNNGLKVVTANMPNMQSSCLGFWIRTGGRYETKEIAGISHFLEHMLFEGTAKRSSKQIKQEIEGIGGSLNGFTGEEVTCYLVKILTKYLDLSIEVLSDMILNPAFSDASIQKERLVINEEIKMYMDLPGHFVLELLNQLMWPGHPLGMFLTGTAETVNSITKKEIIDYKNKFYAPNNIVLAAAGSANHKTVVDSCQRFFTKLAKQPHIPFKPVSGVQKSARINLANKDTEQTHMALGMSAVSIDDPDKYVISLLHILLGANMSSRLFEEVREKRGLAYEISTNVKKYKDTGCFLVVGGIKNEKFHQALEIILKELKRIKKEPVGNAELQRAKDFYAGQMLMALEDTADHMLWIGEQLVSQGEILTTEQILKKIEKITADDITRVADKFFKSKKLNLAAIGPVKEKDKTDINTILEILE